VPTRYHHRQPQQIDLLQPPLLLLHLQPHLLDEYSTLLSQQQPSPPVLQLPLPDLQQWPPVLV
jgi:hypothetical protein